MAPVVQILNIDLSSSLCPYNVISSVKTNERKLSSDQQQSVICIAMQMCICNIYLFGREQCFSTVYKITLNPLAVTFQRHRAQDCALQYMPFILCMFSPTLPTCEVCKTPSQNTASCSLYLILHYGKCVFFIDQKGTESGERPRNCRSFTFSDKRGESASLYTMLLNRKC